MSVAIDMMLIYAVRLFYLFRFYFTIYIQYSLLFFILRESTLDNILSTLSIDTVLPVENYLKNIYF